MAPNVLYYLYVGVMTGALVCFVQAWRTRFDTPRHKRWGVTGVAMSLGGVAVVLVGAAFLGWVVPHRFPEVVVWHRRLALVATAMIVLVAVTGALRLRIHKKLYIVFLPLYLVVYVLAVLGYGE